MPTLDCIAVPRNANHHGVAPNSTVGYEENEQTTLRCYFDWHMTNLVPYDSALARAVGTTGFLVFSLVSIAYIACLIRMMRQPWLTGARLLALYVGLATLYPFAFLSDVVLVRSADGHRVNITLLLAQAFVWYAFIRRYISVVWHYDDASTRHRNKHMTRTLCIALLVGITGGQLVGGVVHYFSLLAIVALVVLLLTVDIVASGNSFYSELATTAAMMPSQWKKTSDRHRHRAARLRLATWLLGIYAMMVTVFSPGFIGLLQIGGEAVMVFIEHLALVVVAFFYWHDLRVLKGGGGSGNSDDGADAEHGHRGDGDAVFAIAEDDGDDNGFDRSSHATRGTAAATATATTAAHVAGLLVPVQSTTTTTSLQRR